MKRFILTVIALVVGLMIYKDRGVVVIPSEAIRIRIISNSNNISDLKNKYVIKDKLESYLYSLLKNSKSIDEAREIINDNKDNIDKLIKENSSLTYSFNFGMNYFPRKTYKGVLYKEGYYESLEVKLGSGIGDNYWCVLFPPLCMVDENEIPGDVSYKLYIKKVLKIDN